MSQLHGPGRLVELFHLPVCSSVELQVQLEDNRIFLRAINKHLRLQVIRHQYCEINFFSMKVGRRINAFYQNFKHYCY